MIFHQPKKDVFIAGPEVFVPEQVVTNEELLKRIGQTSGLQTRMAWIEARTGIRQRRWASSDQAVSDLAVAAARKLLDRHPDARNRMTHLLLATISGDYPSPPTSPFVQHQLGLAGIGTFDMGAACAGFLAGLHQASVLNEVFGGQQLLIAADIRSKFLNPKDLATVILFGDAAAACLVTDRSEGANLRYLGSSVFTDGSVADIIKIPAGGSRSPGPQTADPDLSYLTMKDGAALFFKAVEGMEFLGRGLLEKLNLKMEDIAYLVPHQANLLMIRELAKRLQVPQGRCVEIISAFGNTSGASVGLALHHLTSGSDLQRGQKLLLVAAGGGGFLAASVLEVL